MRTASTHGSSLRPECSYIRPAAAKILGDVAPLRPSLVILNLPTLPSTDIDRSLVYSRHFAALGCCGIVAALIARLHILPTAAEYFACAGAFHATAVVIALSSPTPFWRKGLFVAMAAGLCVLTYRAGIAGRSLTEAFAGSSGWYWPLGFSAVAGAVAYGISMRRVLGIHTLTARSLAAIAVGCLLATFLAAFSAVKIPGLGVWWLAVLWWFAFSGGLWYFDTRPRTRAAGTL